MAIVLSDGTKTGLLPRTKAVSCSTWRQPRKKPCAAVLCIAEVTNKTLWQQHLDLFHMIIRSSDG